MFTSSSAPLNKRFDLDGGEIRKTTRAMLCEGTARTIAAPDAEALSGVLSGLSPRQAVSIGRLQGGDQAATTTAGMADETRIARTLDNFTFPDAPGWLLWDNDDKTMPAEVRARVAELGGPLEALFHIWPEARGGEYAVFPSSSDGVTAPGVAALRSDGRHGYFLVADISRANEARKALEAHAWKAGLAWYALSESGAVTITAESRQDMADWLARRAVFDIDAALADLAIFTVPDEVRRPIRASARVTTLNKPEETQAPER